jgi:hypothetical protein
MDINEKQAELFELEYSLKMNNLQIAASEKSIMDCKEIVRQLQYKIDKAKAELDKIKKGQIITVW